MLAAGSATAGLSVTAALSHRTWAGQPFPYEITVTLFGCAIVLILCGLNERAQRRTRAGLQQAITTQARNAAAIEHIIEALEQITGHLPVELDRRHWQGFNAAVREGFAETGT